MRGFKGKSGLFAVVALALAWISTIILSGMDINLFKVEWDFQRTALLGDSFGVLSSGMAALAAYFAFATYQSAKDEASILARRAAEPSFLNLLERRFQMMENVMRAINPAIKNTAYEKGQLAFDWAANMLWHRLFLEEEGSKRRDIYGEFVEESIKGLTNYHRYVYHIIAYAERQFSEIEEDQLMVKTDPSYRYVQLLRAQLSDSEMELMAFNALYGAGYPKLKRYIERYALFNNIPEVDIVEFRLPDLFEHTAFGLIDSDRPEIVRQWAVASA